MNFLDAMKTGRPMRRQKGTAKQPWPWIFIEHKEPWESVRKWRAIGTGELYDVGRDDYLAEDWEVMP